MSSQDLGVRGRRTISRQKIVETARRLFREEGYRGTTLDKVAAELGVTRAALYYWVRSKEALLCEIHEEALDLLVMNFRSVEMQDMPPADKLRHAIRNHVLVVATNLEAVAVFFQDEAALPEALARRIADRKRDYDHRIQGLVKAAQQEGTIRSDVEPLVVVMSLMGMCNWLYHWYRPGGRVKPEKLADEVVKIAMEGLATAPAR
jgi:TetR/AcrR family transcriptional regulator, cholesterol catabolism regulator